ncbi:phage capsid protein [Inquilinus limosus]|uniref:phage capsid protein n=1 Tax=Inquilinus limosus TaxID=171674 RepID=UPI0004028414|nr:phage capsid protein [Inquilinus limosus]
MADNTVTRLGQNNGSGDPLALFLKVFSGEVLATFNRTNVFMPLTYVRSIASGKSATFPVIGQATSGYHTPGAELTGSAIPVSERVINLDGMLISHVTIAEIDELMNHYDVRGQFSQELGARLARDLDDTKARVLVNTARAAAVITGQPGGAQIEDATYLTDSEALAAGIFDAAAVLDSKNVPEDDRYAAFRPVQYYGLVSKTDKMINRDFGGSGMYAEGKVLKAAGISIVKSNAVPSTNVTGGAQSIYNGDFSNTAGIVWHKSAAGTLKLLDVKSEAVWETRRQSWLMLAKTAVGHGVLRPEAAVELTTDDGVA